MSRLSGWWRIWIVATFLILAFGTAIGVQQRQFDNEFTGKNACFPGTLETKIVSQPSLDGWSALQKTPPEVLAKGEIINPRINVEEYSCVSWTSMLKSWALALGVALAALVVVYVGRWIVAGFSRSRK